MSEPADLRAEIAATFAKARSDLEQAERRALALIGVVADRDAVAPADPQPGWIAEWGTLQQATSLLQRSAETCVKIIRRNGLGSFRDGRWRVDLARCRAYCEARPYPPIAGTGIR